MESMNAFTGKTSQPTSEELAVALGPSSVLWNQLVSSLSDDLDRLEQEWHTYSPKYGWALILKVKKRRIVYLSPCARCFQASFILGDRAMAAARAGTLAKPILKILDDAPHYPEGTGVRLTVKSEKDLPAIRKLAKIKLAN
jgi:hypothetical protein